VEPVNIDVGAELGFDLACMGVSACEDAGGPSAGGLAGPYESVCDEHVFGRPVSGGRMIGGPEELAGLCRDGCHCVFAGGVPGAGLHACGLSAREEDDVVVNEQYRGVERADFFGAFDGSGAPKFVSGFAVKADDALAVVEVQGLAVGGEGDGQNAVLAGPEDPAGVGTDGRDLPGGFVPELCSVWVSLLGCRFDFFGLAVDECKEDAVGEDDFLGGLGVFVCSNGFAGGCIESRYRRVDAECHIDAVAGGD